MAAVGLINGPTTPWNAVNRLKETLTLFDTVCNSRWFENTITILLATDNDVFARKLRLVPLSDSFSHYTGSDNYRAACKYLLQ
ncbi:hypothetical protein B0H19DRAFT_963366 [Mycena capillaripes]|nr:hypothetical protein B0H19DRAFT_963366 [Mycena capillaripes]